MEFFQEIGLFLAEAVILVTAIIVVVVAIAAVSQRRRDGEEGYIEVRRLNDRYTAFHDAVRTFTEHAESRKVREKAEKKTAKAEQKQAKQKAKKNADDGSIEAEGAARLFVLRFQGDIRASETESLREEISAIAPELRQGDEVLLCLESPGGMVHSYGLAASQLQRIRATGASLTVAVDKVAASGGYMMACVADKILAAPFAVIGSIGVVAQMPNFSKVLKKNDVDYEILTAGKYKRTMTMLGENTDAARKKFVAELEEVHGLFKSHVSTMRPKVDIDKIATGETWYGTQALDLALVDGIQTSDDYLVTRSKEARLFEVVFERKKKIHERLGLAAEQGADRLLLKWWARLTQNSHKQL